MTHLNDVRNENKINITSIGARPNRRTFITAVAGALGLFELGSLKYPEAHGMNERSTPPPAATASAAIRPFHVNFSDADLAALRRRVAATRWPERELVTDQSQGVQLATMQQLAHYWVNDYDWRKVEARLNALPQFVTTIDGLDIHFIHVRSKEANALPVIVT